MTIMHVLANCCLPANNHILTLLRIKIAETCDVMHIMSYLTALRCEIHNLVTIM